MKFHAVTSRVPDRRRRTARTGSTARRGHVSVRNARFVQCWVLSLALSLGLSSATAAQTPPLAPPSATFAYTTPAEKHYGRALLEVSVVLGVGFMFYVTAPDTTHDYDVTYSWPIFRAKLTGQALRLDLNHLGTNFVGHPIGGSSYYLMARANRLAIPEAAAIAFGGSLVWELLTSCGQSPISLATGRSATRGARASKPDGISPRRSTPRPAPLAGPARHHSCW